MSSPLIFPVKLEGERCLVLDETQLPFDEKYISVNSLDDALDVLKKLKTRSLGQVLLFFYSCLLFSFAENSGLQPGDEGEGASAKPDQRLLSEGRSRVRLRRNEPPAVASKKPRHLWQGGSFKESLIDEVVDKFKSVRPTFDFPTLGKILKDVLRRGIKPRDAIEEFIGRFDKARKMRARELAGLLPSEANILTTCNVNGELIYLYEGLKNEGKKACFYICETRPYLQGTRLTFWELKKNNIPLKLICDNQAAKLMQEKKVNCVVVGADRATVEGDIINKIGTYALARLAKHFNIPFYPLTQYPRKVDIESIEIEERPAEEAFAYLDLDKDSLKLEAVYPSFDITKAEFITKCIELKL